jgi:predicted metal-binding protein
MSISQFLPYFISAAESLFSWTGRKKAVVARPRDCTLCRECVMGEGWDKRVQLRRVKEHFICMDYVSLVIFNAEKGHLKVST